MYPFIPKDMKILVRDEMTAKDTKAQETLVYERKKSQAHRLAKR
jgi:hypothetical protein